MLKSFANQESEDIFHGINTHAIRKALPTHLLKISKRRLDILNCCETMDSLSLIPSIRSEAPVRDAHGKFSIPIDGNWRIAFRWDKDGPADIEIKS